MSWKGLISEYREFLPVNEDTPALSLLEGNTPLIKLDRLSEEWGIDLHVKYEGAIQRVLLKTAEWSWPLPKRSRREVTRSSVLPLGIHLLRLLLMRRVPIPLYRRHSRRKIAMGKLAQAVMYGAEIISIEGNFDQALKIVRSLSESSPITLVNSVTHIGLKARRRRRSKFVMLSDLHLIFWHSSRKCREYYCVLERV